jgi:hypothetical protein
MRNIKKKKVGVAGFEPNLPFSNRDKIKIE